MDTSYSQLRQNLKRTIDWTIDRREPAFITSRKERKAVLISYDEYSALLETAHLLRSPANARRLVKALVDINEKKNIIKRDLLDEDN